MARRSRSRPSSRNAGNSASSAEEPTVAISATDPLAGPAPLAAKPKPPIAPRRRLASEIVRHRTDYLWVAPALLVMALVIAYPFVYTIDLSFYETPPSSP